MLFLDVARVFPVDVAMQSCWAFWLISRLDGFYSYYYGTLTLYFFIVWGYLLEILLYIAYKYLGKVDEGVLPR